MRSCSSVLFWQTIKEVVDVMAWWEVGGGRKMDVGKLRGWQLAQKFKFLSILFLCT
jgi:hypothetical protein